MDLINALEGTKAPFVGNGFIMGNSACNDVMICHSYDESGQCVFIVTPPLNETPIDFCTHYWVQRKKIL